MENAATTEAMDRPHHAEARQRDIEWINPKGIADSPFQKKRVSERGNLNELAASITEYGVLEALIVRPAPKGAAAGITHELVAGHRRKRGAMIAELTKVPCTVGDYTDDQVLDIQAIENGQREGVHPLDDAELYAELVKRGRTPAQIADKIGRDVSFVTKRLQLCKLTKAGQQALDEGKLTLGAALALARAPEKIQDEALEEILDWHEPRQSWDGDNIDHGHAAATEAGVRKLLEERFMLRLEGAPFPIDDAMLIKKAGACTACPKRTGNQAALFADVANKELCTDPACFKAKGQAYWPIRAKKAQDEGHSVLDGHAAKKALEHYNSGYKKLDAEYYDGNGKKKDVRTVATKAKLQITIAQDPESGAAVELVREADFNKALAAGRKDKDDSNAGGAARHDSYREAQRREQAKHRQRQRVVDLAVAQAVVAAEASKERDALEAVIVRGFVLRTEHEHAQEVTSRREMKAPKKDYGGPDHKKALLHALDEMTPAQARALGVELALRRFAPSRWGTTDPAWKSTLKALGVNLEMIERDVAAEEKAKKAAKKMSGAKKGKAAKKAKPASGSAQKKRSAKKARTS